MKRHAALVGILAIAAGLSACEASGDTGSDSNAIKVMVIGDLDTPVLAMPQLVVGAEAAAKTINAAGGVNGRKITVLSCNTQGDPNVSSSCARKAVSEHVSAVIGLLSLTSSTILPVLEAAKIPAIGTTDINPVDHTSPVSFPLDSSTVQLVAQVVAMPGWQDCKHPAMVYNSDLESASRAAKTFQNLYASLEMPVAAKTVAVTMSMTDVRAQIATLLGGGTDCAWTASTPTPALALVKAVAGSGQDVKLGNNAATLGGEDLKRLGDDAKGVYIASPFKLPGTPEGDAFAAAMDAVDSSAPKDQHAESAYAAVLILADAAKGLTDFSAPKILDALNSAKDVNVGVLAPISAFPSDGGVSWIPRVAIFEEFEYQWDGQALKPISQTPIDMKPYLLEHGSK
jgi:ABC-type branched-subunit amino acid transport system substrate-binding protein